MKLHKSIRKYAKLDFIKVVELLELDSYDLIETFEEATIVSVRFFSKYLSKIDKILENADMFREIKIFKHKTDNCFIIHTNQKLTTQTFYYIKQNLDETFCIHRDKKPAQIEIRNYFDTFQVCLSYFSNGKLHNDLGPAVLEYEMISSNIPETYPNIQSIHYDMRLTNLQYLKNNKFYNKNGLISYYISSIRYNSGSTTHLTFMRNNIKTQYMYDESFDDVEKSSIEIRIKNLNNNSRLIIKRNKDSFKCYFFKGYKNHRLDGPAFTQIDNNITSKEWYVNGKTLPENVVHYEKGLEITRTDILEAMIFDSEYGKFLQGKCDEIA